MVRLYHGTTFENALNIAKSGFSFITCGTGWGSTFGRGIYFSPSFQTANTYAGENGVVLMCELDAKPFHLKRNYSMSSRYDKRELKKLISSLKFNGYNCLLTKDEDEYVFFNEVPFN